MAARIARIATAIMISIKVNPDWRWRNIGDSPAAQWLS
jgi:hypothetical protein